MRRKWKTEILKAKALNSSCMRFTKWIKCIIYYAVIVYFAYFIGQTVKSRANIALPRAARRALAKLGEDISVARKKRRISTVSMAERAFVSRSTYAKIEKGDPTVSMGAYATVLAILGLVDGVGDLADRSSDSLGLDLDEERLPQRIFRRGRRKVAL